MGIWRIGFQILKQIVVTGGQTITVRMAISLYEARVMNSFLDIHGLVDWTALPDLWQGTWRSLPGSRTSGAFT